jgi:hypothetical protein
MQNDAQSSADRCVEYMSSAALQQQQQVLAKPHTVSPA